MAAAERRESLLQIAPAGAYGRQEFLARDDIEHAASHSDHQLITVVRAPLVTRYEAGRSFIGQYRRNRHPSSEPLTECQDVGLHVVVFEREESAGAAHPGLHLVTDQEHAVLVTQVA